MKTRIEQTHQNKNMKKKFSFAIAAALLGISALGLNSCERAAENIAEEIIKPYCYNENGQTVCYANPK
ncbi:MAG: hypothetical protein K0M63_05580 [Weeksellaceae bacterium]|nr:hypothetical protein [Weeksellaceae bacterium]